MPAFSASAPGKIILFGEHAAVYGRPAIAAPVTQVRAKVTVTPDLRAPSGQILIDARDIGLFQSLNELPPGHPLALAVIATAEACHAAQMPAMRIQIDSTIPIASGLGSGAAVSAAIARAVSAFLGQPLIDQQVSDIAYLVDQKHHGTPSGIDNTVVTYAQPIFFVKGQPFERLQVARPITFVIGSTGIFSPTSAVVGDVRTRWQADPEAYERIFEEIGSIAMQARRAIEQGRVEALGSLLNHNQDALQRLEVSSPELDRLIAAAMQAGACGAKLCGGGRGGNMIALAAQTSAADVSAALRAAGAVHTITTTIEAA
jgi:mevalonate kinase